MHLIDTHCHLNMIVKKEFDVPLSAQQIEQASLVIDEAKHHNVTKIINVGTSLIESKNCVALAQEYKNVFASVGIHPNDATDAWRSDLREIAKLIGKFERIVAIGECGLDRHYPDYNLPLQQDVFRAQIELALKHNLALVVHTRNAADETLKILDEYAQEKIRGVIHCFSEDLPFAQEVITRGYVIGIGGILTYPKNDSLRTVCTAIPLTSIVLETDAPFLPPQEIRGKQNRPQYIEAIATFLARLRNESLEHIAQTTTKNALKLFSIHEV